MDLSTILIGYAMLGSFQSWPMWGASSVFKKTKIWQSCIFMIHESHVRSFVLCWIAILARSSLFLVYRHVTSCIRGSRAGDEICSFVFRTKLGHSAIRMSDDDRDIDIESDVNSIEIFCVRNIFQTHILCFPGGGFGLQVTAFQQRAVFFPGERHDRSSLPP